MEEVPSNRPFTKPRPIVQGSLFLPNFLAPIPLVLGSCQKKGMSSVARVVSRLSRMSPHYVGLEGHHLASKVGAHRARERLLPGVDHVMATEVLLVEELLAADGADVLHDAAAAARVGVQHVDGVVEGWHAGCPCRVGRGNRGRQKKGGGRCYTPRPSRGEAAHQKINLRGAEK